MDHCSGTEKDATGVKIGGEYAYTFELEFAVKNTHL
jgi:hypothetical protein